MHTSGNVGIKWINAGNTQKILDLFLIRNKLTYPPYAPLLKTETFLGRKHAWLNHLWALITQKIPSKVPLNLFSLIVCGSFQEMPGQLGDPVEISGAKGTADVTVSRPGTLPLSPVNSSARTQKNVWSSAPRTRWSCCFRTRRNPHGGAAEREAAHLKRCSVRIIMPHKTQRRWLSTPKWSMSVNPVIVASSQAPETREHSSFLLYYPPKSSLRGHKIFL